MTEEEKNTKKSEVYRFGGCVLDADRRELKMAGNAVTLQPKAFEFLLYLLRNRARAVDKDELQDALWPRSIVTETALTRVVMKARRAVGDDADRQTVIRTIHGHGYRFVAELTESAVDAAPDKVPPGPLSDRKKSPRRAIAAVIGIIAVVTITWWFMAPSALSGPVRLAVLPVENATGNAEMDWVETGFMALMNRMLEDRGVEVVSGQRVTGLAGELPLDRLVETNSEFQQALAKTTAFTHLLAARLEHENGLYRLTYTFLHGDDRPQRRTIVDQQPTELIAQAIETVSALVAGGAPSLGNTRVVSGDSFLNEAFARGMSLEYEGRYEEARQLFRIVIEQQPDLFWPRYEWALSTRNLRQFDEAEAELLALIDELDDGGASYERVSANNALGVMYNSRRRNDEAQAVLDEAVRIAMSIDRPKLAAIAHINRALLARNVGKTQVALSELMAAADIYRQLDIRALPGALLNNLSGVQIGLGHLDEAMQNSLAAVESFRLTGERLYESYALSRLSDVQSRLGLLDEAEQNTVNSLVIREELGDRRGVAISLIYMSRIQMKRGNLTRARQTGLQIRDLGTEIDDQDIVIGGLQQIAYADLAAGNADEASVNFAAAAALSRELGDRHNELQSQAGVATARIAIGDFDAALAIADELMQAAEETDNDDERADALNLIAEIHIGQKDWTAALGYLQDALAIANATENMETIATVGTNLGLVYLETGDIDNARTQINIAAETRPNDSVIVILLARLAAAEGNNAEALRIMDDARGSSGEKWTDADERLLESYRLAVAAELERDTETE